MWIPDPSPEPSELELIALEIAKLTEAIKEVTRAIEDADHYGSASGSGLM